MACGRIGRFKGWPFLLEAFRAVLLSLPNAKLIFVGDGEDGELLRREIGAKGLAGNVRVTGFCEPAVVATYMNAADVVVSGSLCEGWSVSMLEALASGKPLVTTAVSGVDAMVIEGENGFVIQERDPVRFSAAMLSALTLTNSEEASVRIASQYSVTSLRAELLERWPALGCALGVGPKSCEPIPLA
jgi:glycosyltransferase involved in cell wall biosynthesis